MYKNLRRKSLVSICSAMVISCCFANNAVAEKSFAVGVNVKTIGPGIEARTAIGQELFARFGMNYFRYSKKISEGNIDYSGKAKVLNVPVMIDYHPFSGSGFRVSAGLAYNDISLALGAKYNKPENINGMNFTPSQIGEIKAKIRLGNKVAPILSLGYDSSLVSDRAFNFNAEIGVMYVGKSKVKVDYNGSLLNAAQIKTIKDRVTKDITKNTKHFKYIPIVSLGVSYAF